ncbi:hypothetical protein BJ508DRAFT_314127 [Ascobolus immersus RN42]|uniref:Uncharacterized protein n=1 Tax=Ascobolus immersus RN42 TaxID=1160509 RepID=A0A3N4HJI0_ASCIM|nr:hypothetical protein BJ508DRAFT_314127 [Ascobolus immersus RN42]
MTAGAPFDLHQKYHFSTSHYNIQPQPRTVTDFPMYHLEGIHYYEHRPMGNLYRTVISARYLVDSRIFTYRVEQHLTSANQTNRGLTTSFWSRLKKTFFEARKDYEEFCALQEQNNPTVRGRCCCTDGTLTMFGKTCNQTLQLPNSSSGELRWTLIYAGDCECDPDKKK